MYARAQVVEALTEVRAAHMRVLVEMARTVPRTWDVNLALNSLVLTSPSKKRIVKVDSSKIYTLDIKQDDGTYKSSRFTCGTIEEAWSMASQAIKVMK